MGAPYFQCPYCIPWRPTNKHNKAPRTIGKYRIREGAGNFLYLECVRCKKTMKLRMQGSPLLWSDFTTEEKKQFNYKLNTGGIDE